MAAILLKFEMEELKKKNQKNEKSKNSFLSLNPYIPFASSLMSNLEDCSVADVCIILPPIIVAQCYWLLKMVWCIYFKMRKK